MYYLHNQPWARPDDEEPDDPLHWNLWSVRQQPYEQLAVGDRVLLCRPAPGGGSQITHEAEVTQVERSPYANKRDAWKIMEAAFDLGWSFRTWRDAPYNVGRPDTGHLLAFRYQAVQEVQSPRPAEWVLRPNGWLALTDEQAASVLGQMGPNGGAQGQEDDPAVRRAVELRAMAVAKAWIAKDRGISPRLVRDTSRNRPYDFALGAEGSETLRVEVKGMRGRLGPVIVTEGEVNSANKGGVATVLIVVSGITVDKTVKPLRGRGGEVYVVEPWRPTKAQLTPTVYRYALPR